MNELVTDITGSAQQQATALSQVSSTVNQMDQVTQQNAAMVEESTAAAHGMAGAAEELSHLVRQFKLSETAMRNAAASRREAPRRSFNTAHPINKAADASPGAFASAAARRQMSR